MNDKQNYLYANDSGKLQVPYVEYIELMTRVEEAQRLLKVKAAVVADLQRVLDGNTAASPVATPAPKAVPPVADPQPASAKEPEPEKVSIEFSAEKPAPQKKQTSAQARGDVLQVPPIKKEIIGHFNQLDGSGRLFNVFKQYYTCLNDACGGTVRVTMKDGFCSLWNYDEWEEFAFADIFEGLLRITIDPRYTDALKSLSLCEVPRLISSRRNVVSVQVDDLNNTVLDVLSMAFAEVGMQVK